MSAEFPGIEWLRILDGQGGAIVPVEESLRGWTPSPGRTCWVHLDARVEEASAWLSEVFGIEPFLAESLLAPETRPRLQSEDGGLLLIVRGLNVDPDEDPEDMVALRIWLQSNLVVSARRHRVRAASELRDRLDRGAGPRDSGELLVELLSGLLRRIGAFIDELEEEGEAVQDAVLEEEVEEARPRLSRCRHRVIGLRRHLLPQRDTLAVLQRQPPEWVAEEQAEELGSIVQLQTRYTEDLGALAARLVVTQEELNSLTTERLNRRLYVLSLITAIFLPLTFLTGLLGINVGGIPGTDSPWAFSIVALVSAALAVGALVLLRWLRWF